MNYPENSDFRWFIEALQEGQYTISKYLPSISDDWYIHMLACVTYVRETSLFVNNDFYEESARLLYKIVKNHSDLVDSNKRSSVIGVILFCLVNDYAVNDPQKLKEQAKRIAKTKGRNSEDLMCRRVAEVLRQIVVKFDS